MIEITRIEIQQEILHPNSFRLLNWVKKKLVKQRKRLPESPKFQHLTLLNIFQHTLLALNLKKFKKYKK